MRACSAPRDLPLPPPSSRSVHPLPPQPPTPMSPLATPTPTRPNARNWFSVKALSGSLPALNLPPPVSRKLSTSSCKLNSITCSSNGPREIPLHVPEDPAKLKDLIAWKDMEIATVQNILKANSAHASDNTRSRKTRKAYKVSVEENEHTVSFYSGLLDANK